MKLYLFGSCSGTEPMPDRHHTALAFEINKRLYWFDAGENCSYTAHLMGLDLLSVSDIFISHPHMDHVGGLANLLWNIKKLTIVRKELPKFGDVKIYMPNKSTFEGIISILKNTEGSYQNKYETVFKKVQDGVMFKNDDVEIEAVHNFHLPETESGFMSFSYRIKAEGKKVVYSGDVKSIEELDCFLTEKTNLLLMETGHHSAVEVLKYIKEKGYDVDKVCFMHHGREILYDYEGVLKRCREISPNVQILNDKDMFEI